VVTLVTATRSWEQRRSREDDDLDHEKSSTRLLYTGVYGMSREDIDGIPARHPSSEHEIDQEQNVEQNSDDANHYTVVPHHNLHSGDK
jgi:hypothetical protein